MNMSTEFDSAMKSVRQALNSARAKLPEILNGSIARSLFEAFNRGAAEHDYNYRPDEFLDTFRQAAAQATPLEHSCFPGGLYLSLIHI